MLRLKVIVKKKITIKNEIRKKSFQLRVRVNGSSDR